VIPLSAMRCQLQAGLRKFWSQPCRGSFISCSAAVRCFALSGCLHHGGSQPRSGLGYAREGYKLHNRPTNGASLWPTLFDPERRKGSPGQVDFLSGKIAQNKREAIVMTCWRRSEVYTKIPIHGRSSERIFIFILAPGPRLEN
jgi:hypothetical protein